MPIKIVRTPNDPHHSRAVVYVFDPADRHRTNSPRPQGRMYRDKATGRMMLRPASPVSERDFFVGLDLAQSNDYTAIAIVRRTESGLIVPFLARTRGRPYPDIVASVADLMSRPELAGAKLIIDGTGVGRPVFDLLRAADLDPISVTITAGAKATGARRRFRVPKRDLVSAVLLALQAETLTIAPNIEHADDLRQELADMRAKITPAGNETYAAREGAHDDLVMALALAVWMAERAAR
ncbi:hypothetical protein LGR54_20820 [Ancylobacter sp. Lp-2]|uniref:phage terminase large subunit family protein n=1 Tax=Ancylobacter sp. Lp-2 TaxID=2881339 RepID=UPI001E3B8A67|nr:hypothetical protein [Ancylobacter sp. Lp-2]MCB4771057.1 hypothetical protein [Ancylobacter sp. Lp-2]